MKIISKKNIYLLAVFVVSLLLVVIVPTYAKFPDSYVAENNMVGFVLSFDMSITNIEEYEEIVVEPNSSEKFNVKITNSLGHNANYGVWYRMVEPNDINDGIEIGKLSGTSVDTRGSIENGIDTTVALMIKNNTDQKIKIDVGVATSDTSTSDIEYLNGKKLINKTLNLLLREVAPGSYVKYIGIGDEKNRCVGKACEGQNVNYVDSSNMGYCPSSPSDVFSSNGWRVAYVKGETAYLVSGGSPECMCTGADSEFSYSSITGNHVEFLPSDRCQNYEDSSSSYQKHYDNLQEVALKYCNADYVYDGVCDNSSVWSMQRDDFLAIDSEYGDFFSCADGYGQCQTDNNLLDIGVHYWAGYYIDRVVKFSYYSYDGGIGSTEYNKSYAVRPVIRLKPSVYVTGGTGTIDDPYLIGV